MTNKSGVSPQVISLPKGGGAMRGLGETFAPDLHSGTGNLTVPIALPSGRSGFEPQLSLVYSTGHGNGPFGLGWSLNIPGVSRKTSKGVPQYDDSTDIFVLSGTEDLVPMPGDPARTVLYRPRTEGLFAQIEHHRDDTTDHWEVGTKDGLVSRYGTPGMLDDDPAVIADPGDRSHIFAWKLTSTSDTYGNRIEYSYLRDDPPNDGQRVWDQRYLSQIRYADHGDPLAPSFLVSVDFEYEVRPDPFSEHRAGFEIRTVRRCTGLTVTTHADRTTPVRSYRIVYIDQRDLPTGHLPPNGASLLGQVEVTGHDGTKMESLPPLVFTYTPFDPAARSYQPLAAVGNAMPARSLADSGFELVDLFGNGLPDIIEMDGTVRYWRNRGGGVFDAPREMRAAPANVRLENAGVQLADMNGDGRADLLVTDGVRGGYYPLTFAGEWDHRSFVSYRHLPSVSLEDPEVRLVDIDGDGVIDALRTGVALELYPNDPALGWADVEVRQRDDSARFPDVRFSDPRVKLADMTGDGLQDIALVHSGRVDYWPAQGHGQWGRRITMEESPVFPDASVYSGIGYDPQRVLLGDVDGDGLADLVYVQSGQVTVWINQSGNGWSDPFIVQGTPPITDVDAVRLADMLGTGTVGILWSYDFGRFADSTYKFLDLTGGTKPYLLNQVDNHMGAVTSIQYAPSTRFYVEDEQRPETRWETTLPFPVQVVARVEVVDAIARGKLSIEYRYHHGYWDGSEREFRGFGRVDQRDTETFEAYRRNALRPDGLFRSVEQGRFSPPLEIRTWFHQGSTVDVWKPPEEPDVSSEFWASDPGVLPRPPEIEALLNRLPHQVRRDALRALRGSVIRTELYAMDGTSWQDRPFTVTNTQYGLREESPPGDDARHRIFFPFVLEKHTAQWDRGDDPMIQVTLTDDYDAVGQPRQQTGITLPRRSAKRHPLKVAIVGELAVDETSVLATHTRTAYAGPDLESGLYLHNRVAQVKTFELSTPLVVDEDEPDNASRVLQRYADAVHSVHERFRDLLAGGSEQTPLPSDVRLIAHVLNHYDGEAFVGRAVGEVGPHGFLSRSETLVLTDAELEAAYGDRRPAYLGGGSALPSRAPADFGSDLGYRPQTATSEGHESGYYINTLRQQSDVQNDDAPQQRGVVLATADALGHRTTVEPDAFWFLPARVIDPVGLVTDAVYDYRVMQPSRVTDPNGNADHFRYTALGFLQKSIKEGRAGEGGTDDKPEVEFTYDFLAFDRTRMDPCPQPIYLHTRRRIDHAREEDTSDETIESREYSDGFGRVIQTRAQAEDLAFGTSGDEVGLLIDSIPVPGQGGGPAVGHCMTDRVVVSGWQVYDNKGQVVERYEPFFSSGWAYQPEPEARQGQHVSFFYDSRGRLSRTVNPDGSELRTVFGIPPDLANPEVFEPTPWESYAYDANDLAPLSVHPDENRSDGSLALLTELAPRAHHFTPTSTVVDGLGRAIALVARNGPDPCEDWHVTRSAYDVRGNLLAVYDALGRTALRQAYDLLDRPLRVESIDAGLRTTVLDATGNPVESRDSNGNVVVREYDDLNRPTRLWACDDPATPVTLREQLEYGDDGDACQSPDVREASRQRNALGRLGRQYDGAGLLEIDRYDFKGNVTEKTRRVISDSALVGGWKVDWNVPGSEDALDATAYQTTTRFDALDRPVEVTYPAQAADATGHRAVLTPRYNRAGALEQVDLDEAPYVHLMAYNAKGQRVLVAYGNGVMTRHAYDPRTFRLVRLRSERFAEAGTVCDEWRGKGSSLQDITYTYDLVGNITSIEDRTAGCGVSGTREGRDRLVRRFAYAPLYRLAEASGRACRTIGSPRPTTDAARCGSYQAPYLPATPAPNQENAPEVTEPYTESYAYDPAGNLLRVNYVAPSGSWTRRFGLGGLEPDQWSDAPNNRTTSLEQGTDDHRYAFDDNGNMRRQNTERYLGWDHIDQLIAYVIQPDGGQDPSLEARYLYDRSGIRVKKWVRTNGTGDGESTVSVDGVFEHRRWRKPGGTSGETNWLHVMDGRHRIALVRRGQSLDDAGPPVQYHLGDHLGSSTVVVNNNGAWINREEYFPYGETSFGSFARKRYRFTGKERDTESGLYYHGVRYYAPWLARWNSCDPAGMVDGLNPYRYARNAPLTLVDSTGRQSESSEVSKPLNVNNVEDVVQFEARQAAFEAGSKVKPPISENRKLVNRFSSKQGKETMKVLQENLAERAKSNHFPGVSRRLLPEFNVVDRKIRSVGGSPKPFGRNPDLGILKQEIAGIDPKAEWSGYVGQHAPDVLEKTTYDIKVGEGYVKNKADFRRQTGLDVTEVRPFSRTTLNLGSEAVGSAGKSVARELGQKTLKVVPFVGIAAGVASAANELRQGNYGAALFEGVGLVPLVGDAVDAGRLGWAATEAVVGRISGNDVLLFEDIIARHPQLAQ